MMNRYKLRCGACNRVFYARLELGPTVLTRFAFTCPVCDYVIRGRYEGLDLDNFRISWDDAEDISASGEKDISDDDYVTTVGTITPLDPTARTLSEVGGGPNLTFGNLIGKNYTWANRLHERVQAQASEWRVYDRLLHQYLSEDWSRFDASYRELMGSSESRPKNAQERHIAALLPAFLLLAPIIPGENFPQLMSEFSRAVIATEGINSQVEWTIGLEESGKIASIQRDLFACLQAYIREWESWAPGLIVRATEPSQTKLLANLRLCRDDFSALRDLYIQVYETSCQSLFLSVGIMNAFCRGHHDRFGAVPDELLAANRKAKPPVNLRAFNKLPNASKLRWYEDWTTWQKLVPRLLNKSLRNSIGHADVRYDVKSGKLTGSTFSISYLDLTAEILDLGTMLLMMLQVCKTIRLRAADGKT